MRLGRARLQPCRKIPHTIVILRKRAGTLRPSATKDLLLTYSVLKAGPSLALTSLTLGSGIAQDDTKNYSVETASCSPLSAACSVCQARVAHFTRTGNSDTPEKAASLPRLSVPFDSACPVTSL
jgi:hypothetical protein